jgi:hypothetical protein
LERAGTVAVREYSGGESLRVDAHMLVEHGGLRPQRSQFIRQRAQGFVETGQPLRQRSPDAAPRLVTSPYRDG